MTALNFLVLSLSTFRLSSFIVNESGPWNIFVWMRERFGIQHDENGDIISWSGIGNFFGPLFDCIMCTSVWVGLLVYASYLFVPFSYHVHVALSLSAVTILANSLTTR